MFIRLLCIGKIRTKSIRLLIDDFTKRLSPYHIIEEIELRAAAGDQPLRAVVTDSDNALGRVDRSDRLWLLDREGDQWSSPTLAAELVKEEQIGKGRITILIGGAYGFDPRVQERADVRWSLSSLTFLHEWARALTVEQLYRATKIARNEPYHH